MDWKQLTADFKQKYEGCYCNVLLEGYTASRVFWLDHIEATGTAPLLHLHNHEFGEVILKYDDSKSDLEFKFPSIGLYNFKNTVVMIRRLYQRQWKKGLCNSTIKIIPIYSRINDIFGILDEGRLNEELAKCLLQPTPSISITEGIHALDNSLAVALSPEFAMGLSVQDNRSYLLWYFENPIGMVDPVSRRIYLREHQFKQELEDFTKQIRGASEFTIYS